jgi:hypothetical protein
MKRYISMLNDARFSEWFFIDFLKGAIFGHVESVLNLSPAKYFKKAVGVNYFEKEKE